MKQFIVRLLRCTRSVPRSIVSALCAGGVLSITANALASGFQLFEQDGASIGNFHAGYAAIAEDASTAFYNPAGITRIKNQQLVFGLVPIITDINYIGTITLNNYMPGIPQSVNAQGGNVNLVPDIHYVAPLGDRVGFGLSVTAPFGAMTDYGRGTLLRYTTYKTKATVVDISPSLGVQFTDAFSFGFGPDVQKMQVEYLEVAVAGSGPPSDTQSTNKISDTAYGYHLGALYQFSPNTRLGISYHSQVVHHLTGTSKFVGPLAVDEDDNNVPFVSSDAKSNITLPPYTAVSIYHRVNSSWAFMASAIYTQWSLIKEFDLYNIAGLDPEMNPSTTLTITRPAFWHNTWNFSVGADYNVTDNFMLRAGAGYDQSPVRNAYRDVELPDNNRYAIAIGGHYQVTKTVGADLSWAHIFMQKAGIYNLTEATSSQLATTDGSVRAGADVYGAQLTWDLE